ncbi:MAG TPA: tetraacyldisaccharide 4'-kinase [Chlamydiales bacterium]|nr:tetraacyldisaccharide 4'-kinase [Chlamydiales bacterium]
MSNLKNRLMQYASSKIEKKAKHQNIFWRFFVFVASLFYQMVVTFLFFIKEKKRKIDSKAFVISVGNIVAGGVGKTPLVQLLISSLKNRKIAIATRGYGRKSKQPFLEIAPQASFDPYLMGDEPAMLKKRFPFVTFFIGSDRKKACEMATNQNFDILILDDGLRQREIVKDLEIVVIDANDPFGKGFFLPKGYLKLPLKALEKADLFVVSNAENKQLYLKTCELLKKYSSAPFCGVEKVLEEISPLLPGEDFDSSKAYAAFCAIGKPNNFFRFLKKNGYSLKDQITFVDHEFLENEKIEKFAKRAKQKGAHGLLCTEKDAIKLVDYKKFSLPIFVVKIGLKVVMGQNEWKFFIEKNLMNDNNKLLS